MFLTAFQTAYPRRKSLLTRGKDLWAAELVDVVLGPSQHSLSGPADVSAMAAFFVAWSQNRVCCCCEGFIRALPSQVLRDVCCEAAAIRMMQEHVHVISNGSQELACLLHVRTSMAWRKYLGCSVVTLDAAELFCSDS